MPTPLPPVLPRRLLLAATLALAAWPQAGALAAPAEISTPPVAEVKNVPSTLHGTVVPDPYRWMEDVKGAQSQAWLKGQGATARSVLDRIDGREAIAQRLAELADAQGDAVRGVMRLPGERYYYMKRKVGEKQFKLVMRQGLQGAERTLVDPELETARSGGVPHAINYYKPSWDGQHLAYGMSAGGSEDASLYVMHIASGKPVGAPVPRVYDAGVHWLPDSRSLTYTQTREMKPGQPVVETYMDAAVMWQRLGGAPQPVFGPTVTPDLGLVRLDVGQIYTVPGSPWVVARTTDTTVPEGKLFAGRLADLGTPKMRWQALGKEADKVLDVALQGDHLYVMLQAGAPRRQVVRVDLRRPVPLQQAPVVAAQPSEGALEGFELTPTALVAQWRRGTSVLLRRYARGDAKGVVLPLPGPGTAWTAAAPAQDSETLLYAYSSWTEPLRWQRLDSSARQGRNTDVSFGLRRVPANLPEVVVTEVQVPSHDGVLVPMTILHKKGLPLDGRNPVLLNGYASYGFSISAGFSTETMVWIERGGVTAMINPRGSGVHGDAWHRAGFKTTKPNTWKDGIAGAKYLIAKGYGSPKTMGITGTSAGGIFVGRAVTEAPELFAAAIFNVGMMDTIRSEESANGITNISEFGSVKDPAEFKALMEMSTYHAVKDGQAYPGVMLVHGMNDPRVDVWQSGKAAARLQAAQAGMPNAGTTLLRLDMQAGHGMGSTHTQRQAMAADMQSFLLWQMGKLGLKD